MLDVRHKRRKSVLNQISKWIKSVMSCSTPHRSYYYTDPVPPNDPPECPEPSQNDDVWPALPQSEDRSTGTHVVQLENQTPVLGCPPTKVPAAPLSHCVRRRRSHSLSSLGRGTFSTPSGVRRAASLPNMLCSNFDLFVPVVTTEEAKEVYRFQSSGAGQYECIETGLVFDMTGAGEVVYQIIPWNQTLQGPETQKKQPAGPLFDIRCEQKTLTRLYLPHCEVRSTHRWRSLSVAHVTAEGTEFIVPRVITDTYVVTDIQEFSPYGNTTDKDDTSAEPVRSRVMLFHTAPDDPGSTSDLKVLLLPTNVPGEGVVRFRKEIFPGERYKETLVLCNLCPNQEYTLSTQPPEDSVEVHPTSAPFSLEDSINNRSPLFQVTLAANVERTKLILRHRDSRSVVWEETVSLSGARRSSASPGSALTLKKKQNRIIKGLSTPVLNELLRELESEGVITSGEKSHAKDIKIHSEKICFVIETVRGKGHRACSRFIEHLCRIDPFFSTSIELK